jgi:SynChlorMet cassette protein ScmD
MSRAFYAMAPGFRFPLEGAAKMNYDQLIANPSVVLREESDDWAVLFDPDTGKSFAVDPVGVFIWKKLDGRHSLEQIIADLRLKFLEIPDTVQKDCMDFLDDLVKRDFACLGAGCGYPAP